MKKLYAIITAALLLCGCTQNDNSVTETAVSESAAEVVTEDVTSVTTVPETETVSETTAYTMPSVPSADRIEVGYSEDDEYIVIGREMWKQYNETLWDYFGTSCHMKWHYTNGECHTNSTDARCYLEVDGLYTDRENEVYTEMNYAEAREFLISELNITEHGFDDLCRFSPGAYVEKDGKLLVGQADGGYDGWDFCYITDYKTEGDFVTYYCEKRGLYCNPDNGLDKCDRYLDFSFTLKNEDGEWKLYSCTNYEAFFMYLVGTAADVNKSLEENGLTVTLEKERSCLINEDWLLSLMEYLESGCTTEYNYLDQGNDFGNYDFMDDFTIDSCSYSWIYAYAGYGVTLNCSDSTCKMFPNGESLWYFGGGIFCPWEKAEQLNSRYDDLEEPFRTAYFAASDFSLYTGAFEFDKEWLESCTDISPHAFCCHAYNPYLEIEIIDEENEGFSFENFIYAMKQTYNINIPQEAFDGNTIGYIPLCDGHGGSWYYDKLTDCEETDSEVKVTIDYYGDELYFYPVLEVEYTFAKNDDGTITLQGAEKIFDKGYELACGTV